MQSVAVIGSKGFLGKALCNALRNSSKYILTEVTRENYVEMQKQSFDILINSAMPSARFWAKNNPKEDFTETVEKTANLLYGWQFKKFVQISTVSARCQLDTVYGRHKLASEKLVDFGDNLVVRFGALYGQDMKKGVLIDMLEGKKVYADGESRYCFSHVEWSSKWIAEHLDRSGTVEVGGRNAIALKDIAKHIGVDIEFEGVLDHQEIQSPEADFPEASDVLSFLDNFKNK